MSYLEVRELLNNDHHLNLELVSQQPDLNRRIEEIDLNRPGLALTGYFEYFANQRVQIFGRGEWSYLSSLPEEILEKTLENFFAYDMVCLIFTHDHMPPDLFLKIANEFDVPVFKTGLSTHKFIVNFTNFLDKKLAPSLIMHGVLTEVFGVGVLLTGASGVGKSETALELVERGHRVVADDAVRIVCLDESRLYGHVSESLEHHMEIRGLGIINIQDLYGSGSVRKSKRIDLIIELEDWAQDKEYDRLGLEEHYSEILGVMVEMIRIPVKPGRNVPILVETAAKNYRLKQMGYHPARNFDKKLKQRLKEQISNQ